MAISVDWGTKIINVPKADMTLVQASPEIRQLDLDAFRLALKDLEDNPEGMPFPDTHKHNAEVTLGGVTLAMVIEIINGYTVTFEDGQYAVNAVGANSNLADVMNVNQVSLRTFNSAGLVNSGGGSTHPVLDKLDTAMEQDGAVYRFTENALSEAPVGEGEGGTGTGDISKAHIQIVRKP